MLSEEFVATLDDAEPGIKVVGIVTWAVAPAQIRTDAIARLAEIKRPLIEAVEECYGARVNPLESTRQAIVELSVEGWRDLLRSRKTLLDSEELRIEPNVTVFTTLPDPS